MFKFFPLKPAPFCTLFAGLGSTNKSVTSLLFFPYLTIVLSSPLCPLLHLSFYLNLSGRSGRSCLLSLPVLSGYNGSPYTHFNRRADDLARRGALLMPSAIPCSLSPLISRIHSSLSRTGGVLSHLNSLAHRFPRFPLRNLCFFVTLAIFSLVYTATDTAFC